MADTDNAPDPTAPASPPEPAAPAAPPPAPAPAPLTAEQIRALVAEEARKAYDAGAAAARRAEKAKAPPTPAASKEATSPPAAPGDDAEFGEALADALGEFDLDKDQRREIRAAARRERPEDVDGFVARWARMFGKGARSAGTPAAPGNPAAAPPNPAKPMTQPPAVPPPAPPAADVTPDNPLRALSEAEQRDAWQAYVRRKGAVSGNPYDPRNRGAWREMRNKFEGALANATVHIGRR